MAINEMKIWTTLV